MDSTECDCSILAGAASGSLVLQCVARTVSAFREREFLRLGIVATSTRRLRRQRENLDFRGRCHSSLAARCICSRLMTPRFCCASDHVGIFISRTQAESWRQAAPDGTFRLMILHRFTGAVVVSTEKGSLFLSRDAGKTWGSSRTALTAENTLSALRSLEAGNQLVVASSTEGLFVLDMGAGSSASADPVEGPSVPRR